MPKKHASKSYHMNLLINEWPLVPRSALILCRSCRCPCQFRAACAARASFVKRYVRMRQDMSRYVQMCQDMSRDVKICQEMSRRYDKICQDMSSRVRPSVRPDAPRPSVRPSGRPPCSFLIIINIININMIVNILSCFGPNPLLHVIRRTTCD